MNRGFSRAYHLLVLLSQLLCGSEVSPAISLLWHSSQVLKYVVQASYE